MFCPAVTDAGPVFATAKSAAACTCVVLVAELLAEFGSTVLVLAVAVLVSTEPFGSLGLTRTTMVMVTVPAASRGPRLAVTVPPDWLTVPCVDVADTKLTPAGKGSVTTVFSAAFGPELSTVSVYVSWVPAKTGSGLSVLVIDTSAWLMTVVLAVPVLLAVLGSPALLVPVAAFVRIVPSAVVELTVTTRVSVALAPLVRTPRL